MHVSVTSAKRYKQFDISKAIFLMIVEQHDVFLGYDCLKKITDFFGRNIKQELATKKYQEVILTLVVETLILLEEFLYTRELQVQKLNFSFILKQEYYSSKKIADQEQLNKFTHLQSELEKNLIANIPLKYSRRQQQTNKDLQLQLTLAQLAKPQLTVVNEVDDRKKQFNFTTAFKLKQKIIQPNRYQNRPPPLQQRRQSSDKKQQQQYMSISSSDMSLLQQKFRQAKQANAQLQTESQHKTVNLLGQEEFVAPLPPTRTIKSNSFHGSSDKPPAPTPINVEHKKTTIANDLLDLDYKGSTSQSPDKPRNELIPTDIHFSQVVPEPSNILQELATTVFQEPPNYQLKMIEKMLLLQKDGKLKDIKMFGQIALQGDIVLTSQEELLLFGKSWNEQYGCQRRLTPGNQFTVTQVRENAYRLLIYMSQLRFSAGQLSALVPLGVIDYIIPIKFFSQHRVPLILIYRLEVTPAAISFCIQYKVNDFWAHPLYDVDVEIYLKQDVKYEDMKSIPLANSVQGHHVLWKAKQLTPQQKGRLVLNLMGINKHPNELLDYIKLSVKTNCCILEDMECAVYQQVTNQEIKGQRKLAVEYKILPNSA